MRHGTISPVSAAVAILAFATAALVLRLPGSVILIGLAPVAAVLFTGVTRPARETWPLWLFLATAVTSSTVSVMIAPVGIGLVNFATLGVVFLLFGVAVLCGGASVRMARAIAGALYYTFGLALGVGWFEVVTGFRLRPLLDPVNYQPTPGRFLVSAWFPNYNDLAVVVSMFAIMVLSRILLSAGTVSVQAARAAAFLGASTFVLLTESRGALISMVLGSGLVCVQALRTRNPRLAVAPAVVCGALAAVTVGTYLWGSAWVQDNSTMARGRIVTNTLLIMPDDSFRYWLGWGDLANFQKVASSTYPGQLMDPHNILLEVFTWFGAPTLIALAILWAAVLRRGVWRMEVDTDWAGVALTLLFVLTPILGIVPSSSLRYYYLFVIAPCAVAMLRPGGRET